jgi:cell wall assembly regulator SMI1
MSIYEEVMLLAETVRRPRGTELPDGADSFELQDFSRETGFALPPELRRWLSFTNGPLIGPGGIFGIETEGHSRNISDVLDLVPAFRKKNWLPIAGDGCGNYYVLASESKSLRPVYFINAYGGYDVAAYAVASELWLFLRFLFQYELGVKSWPFNEVFVTTHDPMILNVTGAPLPWRTGQKIA